MRRSILSMMMMMMVSAVASAKIQVVTTTTDLAALVRSVGGDQVSVISIAKGTQDPHQIEAKPSFMVKMREADLVVSQGLELETAWLGPLITGSRNSKIVSGSKGFLELGEKLDPIEIPKGEVSRAQGDVHPGGNPHFQLDPVRMGKAALIVATKLGEFEPTKSELFKINAQAFEKQLLDQDVLWRARMQKTGIKEVVTFHRDLTYFLEHFGIAHSLQLEPRPGIPPTAAHLLTVMEQMRKRSVHLILTENFYDDKAGEKVQQEVKGSKAVVIPVSVDGVVGIDTTVKLIEYLVKVFEGAAK